MSELQWGLLAIGLLVVVLVLAYNKWQELRYRRTADEAFGKAHQDVLMESQAGSSRDGGTSIGESRVADFEAGGVPNSSDGQSDQVWPAVENAPDMGHVPLSAGSHMLDAAIDFIVYLESDVGFDCREVLTQVLPLNDGFSFPVGYEAKGPEGGWRNLTSVNSTTSIRVGLQLANRRGHVQSAEIERFKSALRAIAQTLNAVMILPEGDPIDAARKLDQFCAEVDIQIAINVESQEAGFPGQRIAEFAEARGFMLDADGKYYCRDSAGRQICAMQNGEQAAFVEGSLENLMTSAITFELDVPRCPGARDSVEDCIAIARGFAAQFHGRIVDDNGMEISGSGLDSIRLQLEPIFATMLEQGIPAGSPRALRLFA